MNHPVYILYDVFVARVRCIIYLYYYFVKLLFVAIVNHFFFIHLTDGISNTNIINTDDFTILCPHKKRFPALTYYYIIGFSFDHNNIGIIGITLSYLDFLTLVSLVD